MHDRTLHIQLGIGAIVAAAFLLLVAIPVWVSSPSNVPNIILSPLFWPWALAGLTGITGFGMILTSIRQPAATKPEVCDVDDAPKAWGRLASIAAVMAVTMLMLPRIGMVWTSMLVFAVTAFLVRTNHPRIALTSAVLVPLVLYAFFAHVAGVAVPQGDFVRLP
ncbi:tripartite tricarboxylate transporter TctB family protein [Hoeflea sp. YIM 152468]|uniref:tripartite tricarboxylate transporter TctB family protein n=1 Tax=Hoeflea sp. YIM 152468 TaxID=3031759 RepID=UPI0023DA8667|nr:tripartite tricarboxylate transporter TctB family protein [Hoeflea sp. YIM 152468]MDF1609813.1 tripartite tricarboxylate transporter TctB family protein [Hoeflea sp. YIM 152468]